MGVAGAAPLTITSQIIACLLALFFNLKFNHDIHFKFKGFDLMLILLSKYIQ